MKQQEKNSTETDQYWFNFVQSHLASFITSLDESEKHRSAHLLFDDIDWLATLHAKDALKHMRNYLDEAAVKRFSERYRSDKYRKKKNKKTLQINSLTHAKIMDLKDTIEADTVDEALDLVLSRKYSQEADEARFRLGENVYDDEHFHISRLAQRLSANDRQRLAVALNEAFQAGWKAAKRYRGRNHDAVLDAASDYMKIINLKSIGAQTTK